MPQDPPRNLAPSALSWWFRHWLAPPQKNFAGSTTVSKCGSWAGTSQRSSQVHFKVFASIVNNVKISFINLFKKAFFVLGDHLTNISLQ
jgi:hypothetical protein